MVVVPLRLQRGVVVARSSVEESPGSSEAFDGTLAQSDGVTLALFRKLDDALRDELSRRRVAGPARSGVLQKRVCGEGEGVGLTGSSTGGGLSCCERWVSERARRYLYAQYRRAGRPRPPPTRLRPAYKPL
jgi:hypothetical protein